MGSSVDAAVTDNYPNTDAVCVAGGPSDSYYGQQSGTTKGWCPGYQWGYFTYNQQGQIVGNSQNSGRGYGYRNCTDWASWRIKETTGVTVPKTLSHGGFWDNNAPSYATVDNTPEAGDAAVWDPTPTNSYGHVAVVESVNVDNTINVSEYNKAGTGIFETRNNVAPADHYVDFNGTNSGGGSAAVDKIDELGFVRTNHGSGQTELVSWHGAPNYSTLRATTLTGYPTISDPDNVTSLAIDVNGDGIDELAFVRTNHGSGQTEISIWHGSPNYTTHLATSLTGYPAISDPQNVTPIAIDVNGDGIDELGFVRSNHSSGKTELSLWHGAPHYTTHLATSLTGYPAISDPQDVTPLAIDVNGDKIDELAFVRTNHGSGRTEILTYHGSPNYTTLLSASLTGYPAISDPQNVTPIAIDVNGDNIDELGFVRSNHYSGRTEISVWHGSPNYTTHLATSLTGYPAITDPQNVTPIAIHLP